jgi:hypothetical protein
VDWINMDHVREGYELLKIWEWTSRLNKRRGIAELAFVYVHFSWSESDTSEIKNIRMEPTWKG